tara:strand:+ start:210 stop:404 length:195 start_codon:yes stop_codon:yes gene_type:complete
VKKRAIVFSIIFICYANASHAYLDPSTGGMLISAIVGMFATLGLVIKSYWYKLKSLFIKKEKKN